MNRPLGITFGGRGAHTATRPASLAGHWQKRTCGSRRLPGSGAASPPSWLLRILGTQNLKVRAAAAAPPQPRLHVDDALLGFQVRIRAAAVHRREPFRRPRPPEAPGPPVPFVAVLAAAGLLPGVPLLAGIAVKQAAERRDRLGQTLHLRSQPRDLHVQRGLIGGQEAAPPAPWPLPHGHATQQRQHPHRPSR